MNCTFYPLATKESDIDVPLLSMLESIKTGKYMAKVQAVRKLEHRSEEQKKLKTFSLPCFTASGTFSTKKADSLKEPSGFIAIDFDDITDIDEARSQLYADPYTYCGFVSVSGKGLCIIVKIDPKKFIESFQGLDEYYFKNFSYQIDQSCKNINRLRFISFDPDLFLNQDSKKFTQYPIKEKGRPKKILEYASGQDDFDFVMDQITSSRIDLTENYQTWIEIGFSIFSKFGSSGEDYFHQISQFHNDYDYEKTRKKYKSFKNSTGRISISTFFHYAKQAGCEIVTPRTKLISTVARNVKKINGNKEGVIKQLKEMDNIPEDVSTPIVEQVFSSNDIHVSDEEDIVFQVEQFLKREYNLRYNEITVKYEFNNQPLTDRDVNSIYLNAKKIIPSVSKDLIISCIDSDRTPIYNPVKEFFKKNSHEQPKGLIQKLSDCIQTPTTDKYAYHFIRKWMIGSVAMWFKHHSPLMLVLAGTRQNTGKTHFFRYLLPNELQPLYGEAELNGDKDENLLMCSKVLIINDEMSNKSKRDITVLKKLCSVQWFNIRKPYGKLAEDMRRIAALAGTSNSLELLSDPTGNRRILPIEVHSIDHEKYNSIDKTDLWIEAYHAFKSGESFHLTNSDIAQLNESTHQFEEASIEMELILKFFEVPKNGERFERLTTTEIKDYIENHSEQRLSIKKLGMELIRIGFFKGHYKVNGVTRQLYSIRYKDTEKMNNLVTFDTPTF